MSLLDYLVSTSLLTKDVCSEYQRYSFLHTEREKVEFWKAVEKMGGYDALA